MSEQVTLTLPDDLAKRVRAVATSSQRGLEDVLLDWIDQTCLQLSPKTPNDITETSLLQKINLGFPADWWQRYQSLISERQAETISPSDLAELITMSESLEMANVQRVKSLSELAQLRGCSIEDVIKALEV